MNSSKSYSTGIGEKETIVLADGSMVDLNANSTLSHKRFFWLDNKEVILKGEGYFKITPGTGFKVQTSRGMVTVLGTEFNILDRSTFSLTCYEGKIEFVPSTRTLRPQILTQGMQIELLVGGYKTSSFETDTPEWKDGITTFVDQPFILVLEELMNQYPVQFEYDTIQTDRLFTGSFTHDNLDKALEATLAPMGITYKKSSLEHTFILSQ